MLSVYPACFFKEKSGYTVVFPDLNGLSTCGTTLEEALSMAVECLAGTLYLCQQEGEAFPEASSIEEMKLPELAESLEIEYEKAFVNLVSVDVSDYAKLYFERSVKKTLTIPAWLNTLAMQQNLNFSQILQEALKSKLHIS